MPPAGDAGPARAPRPQVAALATPKRQHLAPDDLFLLSNFVRASESFRLSESFSPVCLPKFNPGAFVYAYVSYIAPSICLVLVSPASDSFYALAEARKVIEAAITRDKVLLALFAALQARTPRPAVPLPAGSLSPTGRHQPCAKVASPPPPLAAAWLASAVNTTVSRRR